MDAVLAAVGGRCHANTSPEITGAERKLMRMFASLRLDAASHTYACRMDSGAERQLPCVSSVVSALSPQVDWDAKAGAVAAREGRAKGDVLAEWEYGRLAAAEAGTAAHRYAEAWFHFGRGKPEFITDRDMASRLKGGWLLPTCPREEAVCAFWGSLIGRGAYPVAAERGLHTLWLSPGPAVDYAGTCDLLVADQPEKGGPVSFTLYDYKTNARLESAYARSRGCMMPPPFAGLYDEPLGRYAVQLSLYSLALRSAGVSVSRRELVWLRPDGTYETVGVPDVEAQCREALEGLAASGWKPCADDGGQAGNRRGVWQD